MPLLRTSPLAPPSLGTLAEVQRTASLLAGTPAPVPFNTYDLNNPMSLMTASPTFKQPGVSSVDPSFAPAFQPRIGDTGTSFSPSTGIAPGFQPTLDREELATGVDAEKKRLKGERNKKLGFMLYALGGALRGDKDFVQNTMALQAMKEGKEKQEAQKKKFEKFIKTLDPKSSFYDLAKALGPEKLDALLLKRYEAEEKAKLEASKTPTYNEQKSEILYKVRMNLPLSKVEKEFYDRVIMREGMDDFSSFLFGPRDSEEVADRIDEEIPAFGDWVISARAMNPGKSDRDLLDYYNKEYGNK